jgi:hypothetical protein
MSTKKRPGVQAGMELAAQPDNVELWLATEKKLADLPIPKLPELEKKLKSFSKKENLTLSDLDTIVSWKFTVGKARPSIRKLVQSNPEEGVYAFTDKAIRMARITRATDSDKRISECLEELEKLSGIGPATASAVLTLFNPSVFCFMYDEVIDCFMPQRDYKRSTYLSVRKECERIANALNAASSSSSWTPARVATVLWTACRDCAIHGTSSKQPAAGDNTQEDKKPPASQRKTAETKESATRPKRQKR